MFVVAQYQINIHDEPNESTREPLWDPTGKEEAVSDLGIECYRAIKSGFAVEMVGTEKAYFRAERGNSYMLQIEEAE